MTGASIIALRIVYVFDDGDSSDLAVGTIDRNGVIAVTKVQEGEEERVNQMVEELNESEKVFMKRGSDMNTGLQKIPVYRGEPGFIETLCETARRFYGAELQFDKEALMATTSDLLV